MPRTHGGGGGEQGSIGDMLHEKPAAATVGRRGALTVHCDNVAAASTSSIRDMLPKNPAPASIGGSRTTVHRGKAASGSVGGDMLLHKKVLIGGAPTMHRGKAAATTGSIGSTLKKKAAAAAAESNGGLPTAQPRKVSQKKASAGGLPTTHPSKGASGKMQQQNKATSSRGSPHAGKEATSRLRCGTATPAINTSQECKAYAPKYHPEEKGLKEKADTASPRGVLEKHHTKVKSDTDLGAAQEVHTSASMDIYNGSTTAKDSKKSAAKQHTMKACSFSGAKMPQKKMHKVDKDGLGLSRGGMQRKSSKLEADTVLSKGGMLRKKSSKLEDDAVLSKGGMLRKKSSKLEDATKVTEERLEEAKRLIRELNDSDQGEDISPEDFLQYYDQLPLPPPWIDTDVEMEDEKLKEQGLLHALYRFRYCKHKLSQKVSKKELHGDLLEEDCHFDGGSRGMKEDDLEHISEDDCSVEFLKEQGYFKHFEKDGTLDWSFHPKYLYCDSLNDYQRLVPRNYGGTEYARWSEYHKYLYSYRIEKEYAKYCDVLSKELEWMKDYIHFKRSSYKWDFISSRGALQAVKIAATCFTEISATLAYSGYYECIESMSYDRTWFKELDGIYFQIWLRVTQGLSFKDALVEVHHLNKFPLRQHVMKHALEFDDSMKEMEDQYRTCTAGITSKVEEDQALKLIGEAVKKLVNKPKSYEQYIRKKIDIATVIGIPLVD